MESVIACGTSDVGLTTTGLTLVVRDTSNNSVVDTSGWYLREIGEVGPPDTRRGVYKVGVPLFTSGEAAITLVRDGDGTVMYEGTMDDTTAQVVAAADNLDQMIPGFTQAIGQLMARTYHVGTVVAPYDPVPGDAIVIYVGTNYSSTMSLGVKWASLLSTPGVDIFFTVKAKSLDRLPVLDVECTVTDASLGVVTIDLSKVDTNLKSGDYFWQLEARTYTTADPPEIDQVWMLSEGKLYVKPAFKALS